MLEISHHSSSIARGCWKKYYWHYLEGLKPIQKTHALILGKIIHKAFELYYTGGTDAECIQYIKEAYEEELTKTELVDQEDLIVSKYIALGMWSFYPYKDLSEFTDCVSEKEFKVVLARKRGVRFVGRIDGLIKKDGLWWVREFKTTGLTPRQFRGRCNTSSQATGYVYACRKLGFDVQGILYDCIKKPLLRKRVGETAQNFGQRIMVDYLEDAKKKEEDRKAYTRHYEYRSNTQMNHWIKDMGDLADDIRTREKTNKWYRNLDNCWKYNRLCSYAKVCFMEHPDSLTLQLYYEQTGGKHGSDRPKGKT